MICIAVRKKKLSLSRAGRNSESHTLSIKSEHADLEESDIKGLVVETDS